MAVFKRLGFIITLSLFLFLFVYAVSGYISASNDVVELKQKARALIDNSKGGQSLGSQRLRLLLRVQDPAFYKHNGVDLKTKGAGLTTVTQSLAKRLAFENFKPGLNKIKQTTYAMSLEAHMTKDEILALFLDTVPMGNGPEGWVSGFFEASQSFYGQAPDELSNRQFIELISVLIAPRELNHIAQNDKFHDRVKRIERLNQGDCKPLNNNDVWLQGCRSN